MTPREQALKNVPEAQKWIQAAIAALNRITGFNGKHSEIENMPEFKAVKTHFHVTLAPSAPPGFFDRLLRQLRPQFLSGASADPALGLLQEIRFRYFDLNASLAKSSIFLDAPAEGEGEDATAFVPLNRDGTLRITPLYQKVGALNQVLVLVHEGAHFLGDAFQDYSYRKRPDGDDPNRYINLPVQYAIRNADSYAYFALQMGKGVDRILEQEE
jgi:hypothetical protein